MEDGYPDERKIDNENGTKTNEPEFQVYRKRWFVMVNLALLNFSMATIWIGFSPVAYKASIYYNTTVAVINWLSIGVIIAGIVFGFLWSWCINRMGLRACMLSSSWVAAFAAGLRICSTIESLSDPVRMMFLFVGQYLAGMIQPLALYCAPKMSAMWFPSRQRSLATTVAGMANPVGTVVTGVVSPLFVDNHGTLMARYMLIAYSGFPVFCAIMTSIVMTSDGPPTPPSLGGTMTSSRDFLDGVKKVLKNKRFLLLMIAIGSGIGLYSSFATLAEQVLCPWGYSDTIAGVCSSVMTGAGLVGAVIVSLIVDRTKKFSESLKFMFAAAATATVVFSVTHKIYMGYYIALIMGMLGFLSFGISPIGLETGAEVTFPVGVSISTAMIQISGQLISTIMILVLQSIGRPMTAEELIKYGSKCHSNIPKPTNGTTTELPGTMIYDMTLSSYVMSGIMCFIALSFIILFHPRYHRMEAEMRASESRPITESTVTIISSDDGAVALENDDVFHTSSYVET